MIAIEDILRRWALAENDATSYPWWCIVSGRDSRPTVEAGPFLSRPEAEQYLQAHAYRYPGKAYVYCFSGHASPVWRELYDFAKVLAGQRAVPNT